MSTNELAVSLGLEEDNDELSESSRLERSPMGGAMKEFIICAFGEDGFISSTVIDDEVLSSSEKVELLTSAMEQNCAEFLCTLDRLYASKGNVCKDVLFVLKQFHDIFHNNPVRFGEHGVRPAFDHWFKKLNDAEVYFIDDPEVLADFQACLRGLIEEQLLPLNHNPGILSFDKGPRDYAWRELMGLPMAQLPRPSVCYLYLKAFLSASYELGKNLYLTAEEMVHQMHPVSDDEESDQINPNW